MTQEDEFNEVSADVDNILDSNDGIGIGFYQRSFKDWWWLLFLLPGLIRALEEASK